MCLGGPRTPVGRTSGCGSFCPTNAYSSRPLNNPDGTPTDILAWWKMREHSLAADQTTGRPEGLPHSARMGRQYHGEPASSAGAERLFSAASRAHHDLKGSMDDNSLEHGLLALANTE